jgi:hypothetical protein
VVFRGPHVLNVNPWRELPDDLHALCLFDVGIPPRHRSRSSSCPPTVELGEQCVRLSEHSVRRASDGPDAPRAAATAGSKSLHDVSRVKERFDCSRRVGDHRRAAGVRLGGDTGGEHSNGNLPAIVVCVGGIVMVASKLAFRVIVSVDVVVTVVGDL